MAHFIKIGDDLVNLDRVKMVTYDTAANRTHFHFSESVRDYDGDHRPAILTASRGTTGETA
jgi:hypothetical protein